jgi:hypothetical protein
VITLHQTHQPETAFVRQLEGFLDSDKAGEGFALDYCYEQFYLPGAPTLDLLAIVALARTAAGVRIALSMAKKSDGLLRGLNCLRAEWEAMREWCQTHDLPWLELDRPLCLQPVYIPKPWGREIWYTGIEARGQSQIADENGRHLPLPWLLSVCPRRLLGRDSDELILLKVLDPLPQPVFGDLYFEMHEEKREVYIVANVDSRAWPDGKGGIRFGFDQGKRRAIGNDAEFKASYLAAVDAYRSVRVQIDEHLDQCRRDNGIALDAPVDPPTLEAWLSDLPAELLRQESTLREDMERFIHVKSLQVGDVVRVPCFTPHSLLHGVRTVEFQTPVYERKILSFAQKVLTQKHWDTAEAMAMVSLDAPPVAELPVITREPGLQVEEVAEFRDFRVERLTLQAAHECSLDRHPQYSLVMGIAGQVSVDGLMLEAEQALLVAADNEREPLRITATAEQPAIILIARPLS